MNIMRKKSWWLVGGGIGACCVAALLLFPKESQPELPAAASRDYAEIVAEGVIHAVTEYNSVSFYVSNDTLSGFHYALIEAFAQAHGLKADVVPEMSFDKRLEGLNAGKYDVIAYSLLATSELKDSIALTRPVALNKEVLVQRKAEADSSLFIKSQLELAGKTLHVVKGSPTILRIHNLGDEIGDTIYIKEVDQYGPEQLIPLVAHGDIDYAVCDESIARALADSLPQIDISTDISFTQFYAWGVNKQAPQLLDSINVWLDNFVETPAYKAIYRKYMASSRLP